MSFLYVPFSIGIPIAGGVAGEVLYVDSTLKVAGNNNFKFSTTTGLRSDLGFGIGIDASATYVLDISKSSNAALATRITNTSAGTGAFALTVNTNDAGNILQFGMTSSGNTTAGYPQNGGFVEANGPGGLKLMASNGAGVIAFAAGSQTSTIFVAADGSWQQNTKTSKYANLTTAGWGMATVYASARSLAQSGAVASVATYTPTADASCIVSCNILMTAFTAGTVSVVVTYNDESNTARSLTMNLSSIAGTLATTVGAAGAFEGVPLQIRVKANTAITITTTVAGFTGTYNVEGLILQVA